MHSRGSTTSEQFGSMRPRTLLAPIKERRPFTRWGGGHEDKTAIRWGLADRVPWDQIQPRMVVNFRQMPVG